jgi:hypothetical protein
LASCHLCCSNGFAYFGSISMSNIRPLYTEKNRTSLAELIVNRMSYEELVDYATYMIASSYDKNVDHFNTDWELVNEEDV